MLENELQINKLTHDTVLANFKIKIWYQTNVSSSFLIMLQSFESCPNSETETETIRSICESQVIPWFKRNWWNKDYQISVIPLTANLMHDYDWLLQASSTKCCFIERQVWGRRNMSSVDVYRIASSIPWALRYKELLYISIYVFIKSLLSYMAGILMCRNSREYMQSFPDTSETRTI